jgi:hypothetical protein
MPMLAGKGAVVRIDIFPSCCVHCLGGSGPGGPIHVLSTGHSGIIFFIYVTRGGGGGGVRHTVHYMRDC